MPERNRHLAAAVALDGRKGYVIAAAVGINPPQFSKYITGKAEPTSEVKQRIALVLGTTVEELFSSQVEALAS